MMVSIELNNCDMSTICDLYFQGHITINEAITSTAWLTRELGGVNSYELDKLIADAETVNQ